MSNPTTIELDLIRIAWAMGLAAVAIGLSLWQQLGLAGTIALATLRTVVQLFAVGIFLSIVFTLSSPGLILLVLLVMTTVAALTARNRISKDIPRLALWLWGAIFTSTALTITYTMTIVVRPELWYEPRYLIPLTGMVLGNSLTAASLTGERLVNALRNHRTDIETHLSLGATPNQAIANYRRDAIKAGLIPTVNSMMVVGLVTLPGMITGQILGGADPLNAALYQMLIMFMLAFATLTTAILVTFSIKQQFFNQAMQLVDPKKRN
ncbi:ABC transporter permease [Leptothoe spongobia]|uniref:Iron export ABC transporter permease subunit FetB n=1 Tax=Leptothoe spongobia TAU-MAC 1115 TaxID=1967444 RepID=A0A947GKN0_9CYAN|nr:iron export ABC transporter permease subunit FetB [Leptothoe spongobia]MBT9316587.1 iron export ABC transporter permease subunit FetB [Leptothoe spongobia TAU-MAC 1115]